MQLHKLPFSRYAERNTMQRSYRKKKGARLSLRSLCGFLSLELFVFHMYFFDYTRSLLDQSPPSSLPRNVLRKPRNFYVYDNAFFNKTTKREDMYTGFDFNQMSLQQIIYMNSKSKYNFPNFDPFVTKNKASSPLNSLALANSKETATNVEKTNRVLADLGISRSMMEGEDFKQLPPWSQILDNFGSEPVILGLERCEAYRNNVPIERRAMGPAGLFSSGTNVMHNLLLNNCVPPQKTRKRIRFNLWQVPWGKHNPAEARFQYASKDNEWRNQTAVLPIVTVRHPITWLYALCQHSYSLRWQHNPSLCDFGLFLKNEVKAEFGYKRILYPSLIHVWRDWYRQYFESRDYPLLMVRLEDAIFRPKETVKQICDCIGGHFDPDGEKFVIFKDTTNHGKGHGKSRSTGLLSTFIKYGKPLKIYHEKFATKDWKIIKEALKEDDGMLEAFNYKLLR